MQTWKLEDGAGRIRLVLEARKAGNDLVALLAGGKAHIGAIALADGKGQAKVLELAGHREGEIAKELAEMLAEGLGCTVALSCGIHYDAITREEIGTVLRLARVLAERLLICLSAKI